MALVLVFTLRHLAYPSIVQPCPLSGIMDIERRHGMTEDPSRRPGFRKRRDRVRQRSGRDRGGGFPEAAVPLHPAASWRRPRSSGDREPASLVGRATRARRVASTTCDACADSAATSAKPVQSFVPNRPRGSAHRSSRNVRQGLASALYPLTSRSPCRSVSNRNPNAARPPCRPEKAVTRMLQSA